MEYFESLSQKNNGVVFHYCSVETFMKIISNLTLRASNIRKSNDYREVINCMDIFRIAARDACRRYNRMYPEDEIFKNFLKNPVTNEELDTDRLIERAINNESCTYYCVCFSEIGDLLSQWRGYANDGTGVAIGFIESFFREATDYCHVKYAQVEYNVKNIRNELTSFIVNRFENTKCEYNSRLTCSDYVNTLFRVINAMVYNAIFYKDTSFSEEHERRLVYYPFGNIRNLSIDHKSKNIATYQLYYDRMSELLETQEHHKGLIRGPLKFEKKGDNICSFVEFDFRGCMPYLVPEIILGPKCSLDDLDLRLFLLSNGFDLSYTKIRRSSSAYR